MECTRNFKKSAASTELQFNCHSPGHAKKTQIGGLEVKLQANVNWV